MVYFSFLPESSPGCVASSGSSTWWLVYVACILHLVDSFNNRTDTCPPDLVTAIKEAYSKNEEIQSVSVATDGDWFLSTDSANRKKPGNDPMTSRVLRFCHVATMKTGRETGLGNIAWITFTPDGEGFIGVVDHDGVTHCVFEKLPKTLDDHFKTHSKQSQVKMVSIGHQNSWAIVYEDGGMSAHGISTTLADKLKNAAFNAESIILSPSTVSHFVVTYENGASDYVVPYGWKSGIDNQISLCQQNYALELQQLRNNQVLQRQQLQQNSFHNAAMLRI
ncbi:hypothetical protein K443DRAFT_99291 [Laccaria amethystina LaAM-08-1]|uniref:Unplaced genomic scaffold K443scaffold_78, whole genome shotgun sequence n=1 Tax=Laccaria amethystina LaAM-08-1 TaxID=1095629 RepID=A0A0C9XZ56_9AGAR|nr:hypothetical protein K443DRAFT_99291 [Laccaria amethystina LaAM-08-1]